MSAAASNIPRRPAQRLAAAEPIPAGGWVGLTHEQLAILAWVGGTWTSHQILERIISLVNQRDAKLVYDGKPRQGQTKLLLTSELVDGMRCDIRMGQVALADLLDEDLPAIRRISRAKALEGHILNRREAGPVREAYLYELVPENWARRAERNRQEWEAARQEQTEHPSEAEETDVVEVAENQPLILMPGQKSRPMVFPAPIREAFSAGVPFVTDFTASSPIAISFSLNGVIRCSISDPEPADRQKRKKGEGGTKCISYPPNALELQKLLGPIWSEWLPGEPLSDTALLQISAALDSCPVDAIEGASYRRTLQVNFLKPPKLVTGGFFVWCAQQAAKDWILNGAIRPSRAAEPADRGMTSRQARNFIQAAEAGDQVDADLLAEAYRVAGEEAAC